MAKRTRDANRQKHATVVKLAAPPEPRTSEELQRRMNEIVYSVAALYNHNAGIINLIDQTNARVERLLSLTQTLPNARRVVTPEFERGMVRLKELMKKHRAFERNFFKVLCEIDERAFHVEAD